MEKHYRHHPPIPMFIPSSFDEAITYAQQIRYLNDQIEKLKARVEELETPEA